MLLDRPNIEYRDIFWAPMHDSTNYNQNDFDETPPIDSATGLSLVGQKNCGHKREDVLIENSIIDAPRDLILVSLPILSRRHSTEDFPAEQMLRDSHKFDFSQPHLFHDLICRGRLFHLMLAFSFSCKESQSVRYRAYDQMSNFMDCDGRTVSGFYDSYSNRYYSSDRPRDYYHILQVHCSYLQTPATIINAFYERKRRPLIELIESGADLNKYWNVQCLISPCFSKNRVEFSYFGLMSYLCAMCCDRTKYLSMYDEYTTYFQDFIIFLLHNGLSLFLGGRCTNTNAALNTEDFPNFGEWCSELKLNSFFNVLFSVVRAEQRLFCRGIAVQLLALGYGRRELHPDGVPLFDEHLNVTREAVRDKLHRRDMYTYHEWNCEDVEEIEWCEYCTTEMQALVDRFDAGPLSLLQLLRIAVRRAVGGIHFVRRLRTITRLLPPALYDYVADPTELMYQPELLMNSTPRAQINKN